MIDVVVILAVTGFMAMAIWGGPDLRSLLIFMTLAFVMQVFLRVRYRESLKCPHCGFDPMVYKRDPSKAARTVKEFLEKRKDNPQFLLKPQPKIAPIYLNKDEMKIFKDNEALEAASDPTTLPPPEVEEANRNLPSL